MTSRLAPALFLSAVLGGCGGGEMEGLDLEPAVTGLTHQPDALTFGASWDAQRIALQAAFDDGSVRDVTASAVWSSDDEAVATVSGGEVTPTGVGETLVRAVYGGRTVAVPVTAEVLFTGLGVSPESLVFGGAGGPAALQLFAGYSDGSEQDVTGEATWTSADTFELMGDIDLSDPDFVDDASGWVPIGSASGDPFSAHLDGNGFTLGNLSIDHPEHTDQGLFGHLSEATVTNLHLETVSVSGQGRVGALAGRIQNALVQGVTASGSVTTINTFISGSNAGGLIGYATNSEIIDSGADVAVTAVDHNSGGLVGSALYTDIRASYARGDVVGNGSEAINVGGLVGLLNTGGTVENSYATGTVNAPGAGSSGGLVGDLDAGTVINAFYTDDQFGEGPAKGTPISDAELADESTFTGVGWDFTSLWMMSVDDGRPVLQWEAL